MLPLGGALALLAVAIGIDPFLSVLALAAAALLGLPPLLDPGTAAALLNPLVLLVTLSLYGCEIAAERSRPTFVFWHALQLITRPLVCLLVGAHVLTWLDPPGPTAVWAGAMAVLAIAAHGFKVGWTALGWWGASRPRPWLLTVVEDTAVVGFVVAAHEVGAVGATLAMILIATPVLWGRSTFSAAAYSYYLAWSRTWGSLEPFRWRPREDLAKRWLPALDAVPRSPHRTVRLARTGCLDSGGRFRIGWLVAGPTMPAWLGGKDRVLFLPAESVRAIVPAPLYTRVSVDQPGGGTGRLIVPKAGPSAQTVAAELDARNTVRDPEPWFPQRVVA